MSELDNSSAKNKIGQNFRDAGYDVEERLDQDIRVRWQGESHPITSEEIQAYADLHNKNNLQNTPNQTSICSPTYREQALRSSNTARFIPGGREWKITFNDKARDQYVEIGPASDAFQLFFRFDKDYLDYARFAYPARRSGYSNPWHYPMYFSTIKVLNMKFPTLSEALTQSDLLIETCLFELSYLKDIQLRIRENWKASRNRGLRFKNRERMIGTQVPLKPVKYNNIILQFYHQGASSDNPVIEFLSFYQVLEYYFDSVSEELLYNKLRNRINDPVFSTNSLQLGKLVHDVVSHRRENDETEMLRNVLTKYVTSEEVIEFIQDYEKTMNDPYYSQRRERFGQYFEIALKPDLVLGHVAKIVKAIRNALVHSSDRYERNERYVPFSKDTEIVQREIPLIRFLAEKVIIATAEQ